MIFSTEPPEDLCTHTKNHIDSKIPLDFFPKSDKLMKKMKGGR